MDQNTKELLDLYFDRSEILKGQIESFVKFFEESPASFDLEPSLVHCEELIKEMNTALIPDLVQDLTANNIASKLRSFGNDASQKIDKLIRDFDEKERALNEKLNKMNEENKKNIDDLKGDEQELSSIETKSTDSDNLENRIQELKIIESNEV